MFDCLTEIDQKTLVGNEIHQYFSQLKTTIDGLDLDQIYTAIQMIMDAYQQERFIYIFGNGGSASTASHFVTDFNKGVSEKRTKKFRVICLNDNIPSLLAIANDLNYHEIFKKQLENFLQVGDLVIAISGSGNSPNVINAVEYANEKGARTLALVGFGGGKLIQIAGHTVHVPVQDMQQVEDAHVMLMHLIMRALNNLL